MILENTSKQYHVVKLVRQGNGFRTYLCHRDGRSWIAIWLEARLTEELFPYFEDLREGVTFEDLEDIFSWQNGLVVVLASHPMDHCLKDLWKQEGISYLEKLRMLEQVITGLCVREIPVGIATDLLSSGNLGVCTDGVAGAYYDLQAPETYPTCTMDTLISVWNQGIKRLFAQEIRQGQGKELLGFCQELSANPPNSTLELYQRFLPVKASLEQQLRDGNFQSDSRSVRIWLAVKKTVSMVRKVLVAAVVIGAVALLLYQLWPSSDLEKPAFTRIGSVSIDS